MPISQFEELALMLLFSLFIGVNFSLMVWAFAKHRRYRRAKMYWIDNTATIKNISVELYSGSEINYIYPNIIYQYYYQNKSYTSNQVSLSNRDLYQQRPVYNDMTQRYETLNIWWNELQLDDTIHIKLDSKNPDNTIINCDNNLPQPIRYMIYALGSGVSLLITVWLGWYYL